MPKNKSTGKKLADMMYGNPEGAAFGITPMIGKRREDRQDREAAKSFPVDLARGVVAGAVGLPGDIESLARLPYELISGNESPTFLPTSEDVLKRIPFGTNTPAGQFASGLGTLAGGSANIGAVPRAVKKGALAAGRAGERKLEEVLPKIMERGGLGADFLLDLAQGSRSNVIKPKGGNWLGGRLMGNMDENVKRLKPYQKAGAQAGWQQKELDQAQASLERLKNDQYTSPMMVEAQQNVVDNIKKKIAVNNWVESNLGKYVKNQMATPEDPIRLLLDKRTKEIEAKHAKDLERAERMAQRAMDEPDPRRQANMIRESERLKMEANVERQFAMDSIIPSRMQDYSPDADYALRQRRQEAGFPAEGMGESEAAKRYETLTDDAISSFKAGEAQDALVAEEKTKEFGKITDSYNEGLKQRFDDHIKSKGFSESEIRAFDTLPINKKAEILDDPMYESLRAEYQRLATAADSNMRSAAAENPFITKLDPETTLYSGNTADMGFDHVIDILKQDVMEGRIRPEQLNKVSVEDAVRRTMEFDQEAARKMAEAQIKNMEGFPVYKEYPEGYRWVELKKPEDLPEGYTVDSHGNTIGPDGNYIQHPGEKRLEEALQYEGDTMGHCVGGYCPDVLEGKSRIFSLRDARGEPHVTIEVEPNQHLDYNKWYGEQPTSYKALLNAKKSEPGYDPYQEPAYLAARDAMPPKIVQIKGKQNARPVEKYDKYTQDFVKSGQYSDVGDLENTGLYRADPSELGMFIPSDPRLKNLPGRRTEDFEKAKQAGLFGDQKYLTRSEWEDILRKQIESESGPLPPLPEDGMAHGGRVHISDNPDVMQLELAGGGLVKGLKAAAKASKASKAGADAPKQVVEAPSIIIPSKISNVKEAIRQSKGDYGARRVERAADEVKNLEKLYKEHALREAFGGDNAKALMTMNPADFEKYAAPLHPRFTDKNSTRYTTSGERMDYPEYMSEYLPNVGAFNDVPFLLINKEEQGLPLVPFIAGHEGRHRNRVMTGKGESAGLVQLLPRAELREPFPRRHQDEYIEALKEELDLTRNMVLPERYIDEGSDATIRRPAIKLPDVYAEGGEVHMQAGGLAKAIKAAKAAKEAPMKASEALGRIEGRPLVITQADRTKVGGGFLGGPGFSGLQLEDPAYRAAEAAWAVKNPGTAKMILGGRGESKDAVYAAMLGTPTQHQSNQMVFDKLLGDFKKAAKKGGLDPELRDRINMRLANSVDKDGNNIFPPDVDILDKNFKDLASTFDRRSVTANLIGGMGVGGKKGQIIDYDKIIRQTTDPMLLESPTGALGNRLFTLSGGIIERPDLHPAFPTIMQGEDLGVSFDPVARNLIMKDFTEKTMREKGRAPGIFDYTRGYPPSQLITEDILTELQKMGKKAGGEVTAPAQKNNEQGVQNPVHFTENPDAMRLALSKRN